MDPYNALKTRQKWAKVKIKKLIQSAHYSEVLDLIPSNFSENMPFKSWFMSQHLERRIEIEVNCSLNVVAKPNKTLKIA